MNPVSLSPVSISPVGPAQGARGSLRGNPLPWSASLIEDLLIHPVRSPSRKAHALQRVCQALCRAHGIVPVVHGSVPNERSILVSNHLGYIDPIAICSAVPAIPIAKSEVRNWPLVGSTAARYGTVFVERGNPQSGANALRKAVRRLAGGASVLNFPEGTTTREAPGSFHTGVFGLSRLVAVPVVPVCIRFEDPKLCWIDDQTFLPHYLRSLRNKPHVVHIEFGRAMPAKHHRSNESHAEAARVWIRGRFMC